MVTYKTRDEVEAGLQGDDGRGPSAEGEAGAEAPSDSQALLAIDRNKGIQYAQGDEEFYLEMLKMYADMADERKAALNEALQNRDARNYVRAAHDLKSNSRLIGAENFAELAWQMESAGKKEDFQYIEAHHAELMSTYDKIIEEVAKLC